MAGAGRQLPGPPIRQKLILVWWLFVFCPLSVIICLEPAKINKKRSSRLHPNIHRHKPFNEGSRFTFTEQSRGQLITNPAQKSGGATAPPALRVPTRVDSY